MRRIDDALSPYGREPSLTERHAWNAEVAKGLVQTANHLNLETIAARVRGDHCPCGAVLKVTDALPHLDYWQATCEAGHVCQSRTLEGPWWIVG